MTEGSTPVALVVEDEFLIRLATIDALEVAGLMALEAGNADEAVAILESRGDVSLVVTDINMPGSMDGADLAHAIKHRWPPIKVIVMSGRGVPAEGVLPPDVPFLMKPFAQTALTQQLQNLGIRPQA